VAVTKDDIKFMARAIQLAKKGQYTTHPNPRVGCVITSNHPHQQHQQIIGEGYHQRAGEPHAEINALLNCKQPASGGTAYVTLEPCSHTGKTPPCANALIEAKIKRVVIAMQDPNPQVAGQGIQRLLETGITVEVGVLETQSRQLNPGFIKRMEQGLPWVRVKLAMSLDGRTAMASGESKWITGSEARQDVQKLRASVDAILTGIGTVLADDPSLNVRLSASELQIEGGDFEGDSLERNKQAVRQPKRIVIDTHLKMPLDAKLIKLEGETFIVTAKSENHDKSLVRAFKAMGVNMLSVETDSAGRLSLTAMLKQLAKQEINEVHVEAGATLCGALIQQQLVDEIILYMAPILMGSNAKGLLNLAGLDAMKDKIELSISDIRSVGKDLRLLVKPIAITSK